MITALLTAGFFALSIVCAGRASRLIGATRAHFFRLVYAMACLALYAVLFGQGWQGAGFQLFLLSGILGIAVGDLATFRSLRFISPRLAVLIVQCLCAPFAAFIEWRWLGTTLTPIQLAGGGVILLGTSLALLPGIHLPGAMRAVLIGGGFATCGSLLQAVGAVMSRKANALNTAAGFTVDGMTAAFQRLCGATVVMGAIYLIFAFGASKWSAKREPIATLPWRRAWPWIVANGTAGLVLGVACFQWALMKMPAAVVLSIVALTPLLTIPIAYVVDKERPSLLSIIGSILAVVGVIILQLKPGSF